MGSLLPGLPGLATTSTFARRIENIIACLSMVALINPCVANAPPFTIKAAQMSFAIANELIDMDPHIQRSHHVHDQHLQPPAAPDLVNNDDFTVPREDPTFQDLGTALLGNPRQRGMARLCFCSPAGAIGWMPCGLYIGQRAEFIHLAQHAEHGDVVFKRARLWACKIQGCYNMPKDVRWCLWSIYMLSTEALYNSRDAGEATIWEMRGG